MSINYENFTRLLPFQDCLVAKRQRQQVWARWDANNNGFISIQQIQEGFLDLFNLEVSEDIAEIMRQCIDEMKKRYNIDGKFGPNYMEKREFRGFLEHLHRHIKSLVLYQTLAKNNQVDANKLIDAASSLINKVLDEEEKNQAKILSRQVKITFNTFEKWLTSLNFYAFTQCLC